MNIHPPINALATALPIRKTENFLLLFLPCLTLLFEAQLIATKTFFLFERTFKIVYRILLLIFHILFHSEIFRLKAISSV